MAVSNQKALATLVTTHMYSHFFSISGYQSFYSLVCTILIVICCIHLHIHTCQEFHLILSSLDFVVSVVTTLIFH